LNTISTTTTTNNNNNNYEINTDTIELSEITENDSKQTNNSFLLVNSSFSPDINQESINSNLSMLQIIQEEQNEMSMTLSSCSSQSSSPSITPRTIRPLLTLNKPSFEYPLILNGNENDIHKNNIMNQYLPALNRLQNNQ
jgi:hypothetical protein